ncbi:hypothetical protein [Amycolatopsis sp. FDAARGOS 1241]|uniref:hypothetical protein n=1 Tax=Amycolatopsis sp. FDAARGOS 1241 TaxID=2778070 RepID=UPI001EF266B7|nr:hypothetical protein [Amycolatopsis sp. FDAARGOS 1241]
MPGDEAALDAFSTATATFAAHLDFLATIAGRLADHGVAPELADGFVTDAFGQLGQSLGTDSLAAMTAKHTTPGGIGEQLNTVLREAGVPAAVRHALDGCARPPRG